MEKYRRNPDFKLMRTTFDELWPSFKHPIIGPDADLSPEIPSTPLSAIDLAAWASSRCHIVPLSQDVDPLLTPFNSFNDAKILSIDELNKTLIKLKSKISTDVDVIQTKLKSDYRVGQAIQGSEYSTLVGPITKPSFLDQINILLGGKEIVASTINNLNVVNNCDASGTKWSGSSMIPFGFAEHGICESKIEQFLSLIELKERIVLTKAVEKLTEIKVAVHSIKVFVVELATYVTRFTKSGQFQLEPIIRSGLHYLVNIFTIEKEVNLHGLQPICILTTFLKNEKNTFVQNNRGASRA